jgi:hypothetical protein
MYPTVTKKVKDKEKDRHLITTTFTPLLQQSKKKKVIDDTALGACGLPQLSSIAQHPHMA